MFEKTVESDKLSNGRALLLMLHISLSISVGALWFEFMLVVGMVEQSPYYSMWFSELYRRFFGIGTGHFFATSFFLYQIFWACLIFIYLLTLSGFNPYAKIIRLTKFWFNALFLVIPVVSLFIPWVSYLFCHIPIAVALAFSFFKLSKILARLLAQLFTNLLKFMSARYDIVFGVTTEEVESSKNSKDTVVFPYKTKKYPEGR